MRNTRGVLNDSLQEILKSNVNALSRVQGSLVTTAGSEGVRSIIVTSCNRGEGKTVTAVAMANALSSQANAQVLLIDGNFDHPVIHEHFGLTRQPGLVEYLTAEISFDDAVCPTDNLRLMVLPLGEVSSSLFNAIRLGQAAERLAPLREKFDYVICDGSSVLGRADFVTFAGAFDGIVLVVECENTRWEVAQTAKEHLAKAGTKIIGVTLNNRRYYIPSALYSGA